MSSLSEPMISDEPSRDPVMEVASSTELMQAALQEYIVRLMFEHGKMWNYHWRNLSTVTEYLASKEFKAAKVIKESEAPF